MEKTALVTGAGRGIGFAIAQFLLKSGYKTIAVSRNRNDLEALFPFGDVLPFVADLTHADDRRSLAEFCKQNQVAPQVLVNNAGAYLMDDVLSENSELQSNLDVNLIQAREITSLLWPSLKDADGAHVFNIVSVLGRSLRLEAASYTMAKHAMAAYNKLLFREGRKYGVKVTGIFPASVYTSAWHGTNVNPKQLISPNDIAQTVGYCLSLSAAAVPDEIHLQCMDENF